MYLLRDRYACTGCNDAVKLIIEFLIPDLALDFKEFISAMKLMIESPNVDRYLIDCWEDVIIWEEIAGDRFYLYI